MKNIKLKILLCIIFSFAYASCEGMSRAPDDRPGGAGPSLTKAEARKALAKSLKNPSPLADSSQTGCEAIPFPGIKTGEVNFSGKACSIKIQKGEVSVSFPSLFLKAKNIAPLPETDLYITELSGSNVLIIQHHSGKPVSATYTAYDSRGNIQYGRGFENKFKRECLIYAPGKC